MARKNRIVVDDGYYHVDSRIAHREFFLRDPEAKERMITWMYGIADFCGIEVLSWNIMDNHFHMFLHVPPVPEQYYRPTGTLPAATPIPTGTLPNESALPQTGPVPVASVPVASMGSVPTPSAFSMRPPECRAPRWMPDLSTRDVVISPVGDTPSAEAIVKSIQDGVPVVSLPRPATGFTMTDDEMLARLANLYRGTPTRAEGIAKRWQRLREAGEDEAVEAMKDRYCRRMYNVSQFMKDFKQRVSEYFNRECGHEGTLWDGRFFSMLVENTRLSKLYVTSYIEWNAPKAGLVKHPKLWEWCSYGAAHGNGPFAARAREGFARMFGSWEEAQASLESIFAEKLPDDLERGDFETFRGKGTKDAADKRVLRMSWLVKIRARKIFHGGFFARSGAFVNEAVQSLPARFPRAGDWTVRYLSKLDWELPEAKVA